MNNTFFILLFTLAGFMSTGQGKQDKDKQKIIAACDKFMQTFQAGKFSEAIQMLKQTSVIDHSTIDTLDNTVKQQMDNVAESYGKIIGYEFIKEKTIKDFLSKRIFILKFSKYYLRFNFILYNNGSGWTITSFKYDEDIDELF